MFIVLIAIYVILSCFGLLFIKLGGSTTQISFLNGQLSMNVDLKLLMGLCCYVVSFFLFTYIIQKKDLSFIVPICVGAVNLTTFLMGVFILKEKVTHLGTIGAVVVVLGIILMNIKI